MQKKKLKNLIPYGDLNMNTIEQIDRLIEIIKEERVKSYEQAPFLRGVLIDEFVVCDIINFLYDLVPTIEHLESMKETALKYVNGTSENLVMAMLAGSKMQKESQNKEASQESKP